MLTDMQKTAALAKEAKRLGVSYGKLASGLGFTAKEKLFQDYERELAAQEKRELIRTYNEWFKRSAFERECRQCAVRLWREVEGAGNRYAKERTLEHADGLYRAVYGVGVPNSQALGNLRGGGG